MQVRASEGWLSVASIAIACLLVTTSFADVQEGGVGYRKSLQSNLLVTSFNIHYVAEWQKKLQWNNRKQAVISAIDDLNADIIAFQEMETFAGGSYNRENRQLDWVLDHFPEYRAGAYGDAAIYPNTQPILYRHERFKQLDQRFYFFSETPDVIYSRTF